jgi:hypothetical protein
MRGIIIVVGNVNNPSLSVIHALAEAKVATSFDPSVLGLPAETVVPVNLVLVRLLLKSILVTNPSLGKVPLK